VGGAEHILKAEGGRGNSEGGRIWNSEGGGWKAEKGSWIESGNRCQIADGDRVGSTAPVRNCDLRQRTKQFALRIIKLASMMPRTREAEIIAKQMVKSGTSIGANYREVARARSKAEFTAKVGVVEQEADETLYWLEIVRECGWANSGLVDSLATEADELVAIFTTIGKRSKK
jgi:four helix bundle protein